MQKLITKYEAGKKFGSRKKAIVAITSTRNFLDVKFSLILRKVGYTFMIVASPKIGNP